ncbi:hypothetical protein EZS27_023877, partial [termite gut metagenome]
PLALVILRIHKAFLVGKLPLILVPVPVRYIEFLSAHKFPQGTYR